MSVRYKLKPCDSLLVRQIMREAGLPHFIATTLVARGIKTSDDAKRFLDISIDRNWRDPYTIPGMEKIVNSLQKAILEKKRIIVFGDFDLDGISATAVMTRALRALGGSVIPFVPNRFEEGYGVSKKAIERCMQASPDLIITVDCGIANGEEIEILKDRGVEVLVTDHHEASDLIPQDVPICDPKYNGDEEDGMLAGVGVALKVVQALGTRFGFPYLWHSYLDLACLGTLADMMPMKGQNRALVQEGLARIRKKTRYSISAILQKCGFLDKPISYQTLSFSIIPRLNSAGRMGNSECALDLLLAEEEKEAYRLSEKLEELNIKRREMESQLEELAMEQASKAWHNQSCLILSGENWHEGVKGIIASHVVNEYNVPTILFSIDGDEARGSGRTFGNINLFEAVDAQKDLLIKYGGHKGAVGVTIKTKNLPEFERRINEFLKNKSEELRDDLVEIDAVVSLDELTIENVRLVEKMGPFGQENPTPLFLAKNVTEFDGRAVGNNQNHFLCKVSNGNTKLQCIKFKCPNIEEMVKQNAIVNVIFYVYVDTFRNVESVKMKAESILPLTECPFLSSLCSDETAEFLEDLYNKPVQTKLSTSKKEEENNEICLRREEFSKMDYSELKNSIIEMIIGNNSPHKAQLEVLENLESGKSTLGIMGTGRGKSLIFHSFAACQALKFGKASIFVYPLRALLSDQHHNLKKRFREIGLKCAVLNSVTPQDERVKIYEDLKNGEIDIILTTPEYLTIHIDDIEKCKRIGFLVVDEAHHIGQTKTGARTAYLDLKSVIARLGNPIILAVTATADRNIADSICDVLPINAKVFDNHSRDNLIISDKRNIAHRDDYLAQIIANGGKTVVYVNSREQSVAIARRLRMKIPHIAPYIGFYNAGLDRHERNRIEDLFRNGEMQVLVATSAFGEGVDIPNIRNVCLYHMPFNFVEFNQMSGRAGRDGEKSVIHVCYGKRDELLNQRILDALTPPREIMGYLYKSFMDRINNGGGISATFDFVDFYKSIENVNLKGAEFGLTFQSIECAFDVFSELNLLNVQRKEDSGRTFIMISKGNCQSDVDLYSSSRYCEGLNEIENFKNFADWALNSTIKQMTNQITHPIIPSKSQAKEGGE